MCINNVKETVSIAIEEAFRNTKDQKLEITRVYGFGDEEKEEYRVLWNEEQKEKLKEEVQSIIDNIAKGKENEEFFNTYLKPFETNEVKEEAKERLGDNDQAYYVLIYAMRLFKLMEINAPQVVINNEAKSLAEALVVFNYGC